jgi:hypothetical protein
MMIELVMYGMIPSENTANWVSAPPENRHVRAQPEHRDDPDREQDLLAEVRDLERVDERSQHGALLGNLRGSVYRVMSVCLRSDRGR